MKPVNNMKTFILGYNTPDDKELTLFENEKAAFDAEEWVCVYADTLEEAKLKYESAFEKWQQSEKDTYNK